LGWLVRCGAGRFAVALASLFSPGTAAERRSAATRLEWARLVATLGALKGVFVKAGQFAANRHDVLPPEATQALASLRDRVPALPFQRIRACVEDELGAPLEELFESFETEPLGAASVAQVHCARLWGGERVAVKVQYPWLARSLACDLAISRLLLTIFLGRSASEERRRLFDEFAAGVREELDFQREARVAREIAENLAGDAQIVVPRVIPSHSSSRILTMEYRPALSIDDAVGLERLGVDPAQVLEILGRAYARQVFVDGLFHADPHPGNLFVLDEATAAERPRVLFIDFGLSRRLDPKLRRELRQGIYAVMQRDVEGFLAAMQRMQMIAPGHESSVRIAVAEMFARLQGSDGPLGIAGSEVLSLKDQAKALLRDTPGLVLPNDLLLYAKTMSYLFSLGDQLAPEVDLLKISLPHLLRFLAERDPVEA
jgi:predicted unusual protein kinase regulating ubiquinone biosynthesis (AarF/ABC1/UbiB family)